MRLPMKTAVVDPSGQIIWAFNHVTPELEFANILPPLYRDEDVRTGEIVADGVKSHPDHVVIDLTTVITEPGHWHVFLRDHHTMRIRPHPEHGFKITRIVTHLQDDGTEIETEEEHPLEQIRRVRRNLQAVAPVKETAGADQSPRKEP